MWRASRSPRNPNFTEPNFVGSVFDDDQLTKALVKYLLKSYDVKDDYRRIFGTLMNLAQNPRGGRSDLDRLRTMVQYTEQKLTKLPIDQEVRANNRVQELAGVMTGANVAVGTEGYLDYGCGDGSITVAIGQALGLPPSKIFGLDIFDVQRSEMVYLKLDPQCPTIPLASQSIDFITAYVAFHHLATPQQTAAELARVATQRGVLIIREHDVDPQKQPLLARFLNLIHAIVILQGIGETGERAELQLTGTWEQQKQQLEAYFNTIHYHDQSYWDRLLEAAGFRLIKHSTYQGANPQKLYYGVYQR